MDEISVFFGVVFARATALFQSVVVMMMMESQRRDAETAALKRKIVQLEEQVRQQQTDYRQLEDLYFGILSSSEVRAREGKICSKFSWVWSRDESVTSRIR